MMNPFDSIFQPDQRLANTPYNVFSGGRVGGNVGGSGYMKDWDVGALLAALQTAAPRPAGPAAFHQPPHLDSVQDQTNFYFKQFFARPPLLSVKEFVHILKDLRTSSQERDNDVFACIVKNVFQEFEYMEEYPKAELHLTALLYGSLVREKVVAGQDLITALRCVMKALCSNPSSRLFSFGVVALEEFLDVLGDYPHFTATLVELPYARHLPPPLNRAILRAARGQARRPPPGPEPPVHVQDEVSFTLNNLTEYNVEARGLRVWRETLGETAEWVPWLAAAVVARVGREPNFHGLYATFVFAFPPPPDLPAAVKYVSFENAKKMLEKAKIGGEDEDRRLVKNIASWLGLITLARDVHFPDKLIDLKAALKEAEAAGESQLVIVVPFVAKILHSAASSRVFRLPHPWTLGLARHLARLHAQPKTKLNLKFEVELLCKNLGVSVESLQQQIPRHGDESLNTTTADEEELPPPQQSDNVSSHPPELVRKAESIFLYWLKEICDSPTFMREPDRAFDVIVWRMKEAGVLHSDPVIAQFIGICTELCVDAAYSLLESPPSGEGPSQTRRRCFELLDALARLVFILIKQCGDARIQLILLHETLRLFAQTLLRDAAHRGTAFRALPYQRFLYMMLWEMGTPHKLLAGLQDRMWLAFATTLADLSPAKVPAFAFSWWSIVGSRPFLHHVLGAQPPNGDACAAFVRLMVLQIEFLSPFLLALDLTPTIERMYKGTLRVLLVVLHDFPELLVEYGSLVVEVIPPNCVQLRNLVLSAYPRQMRLPDPFSPGLSVDSLPDMRLAPPGARDGVPLLESAGSLLSDLDDYLSNRQPVSFLSELPSKLLSSAASSSASSATRYNGPILNALVLYTAQAAIADMADTDQRPTPTSIAHTSYMDVFQSLALNLDTAGRYLFFNSIANQLRYPNSHTHYFSSLLLYLFQESNQEVIQEQITRILFERLVALRPHPWGLLITFIQLIKNPQYHFWDHDFVRCAPEIERLFESVATCLIKETSSNT